MSTFAVLLLCAQACLVQNVYSQYLRGPYGPAMAGPFGWEGLAAPALTCNGLAGPGLAGPGLAWDGLVGPLGAGPGLAWDGLVGPLGAGLAPLTAYPTCAAYGGAGVGDVAVAGEMAAAGTTAVAGEVPILGAVEFGGIVPAAGAVSIAGNCGCGCREGYLI